MYSDKNKILEAVNDDQGHTIVKYEIDTSEGNSGGGLLTYKKDGSIQQIGVHCGFQDDYNIGAIFTKKIVDTFIKPTIKIYQDRIIRKDIPDGDPSEPYKHIKKRSFPFCCINNYEVPKKTANNNSG